MEKPSVRLIIVCLALSLGYSACVQGAETGTVGWIKSDFAAPARAAAVNGTRVEPSATPLRPARKVESRADSLTEYQQLRLGARLFTVNCAPCHRANGEGNLRQFPPLNSSPLVTAQMPEPLIETVLYGRGVMPAFSPTLNNVELASVLTYIRQAWDNQAAPIGPEQIEEVRRQQAEQPN